MFIFKPYNDLNPGGGRRDEVCDDLKKDFHYAVYCEGLEDLNERIFVRMSGNFVQFFLDSGTLSGEKPRMIESISLTNRKDTGYDLLYFAEDISETTFVNKDWEEAFNNYLASAQKVFFNFPFFKSTNKSQVFMRICLLEFLLAVDTHDDVFAITPGFDEMRSKLRESKVYLMLCAKLRYCMYCYKKRDALNDEEMTFVVSKYADLLMDKAYNKMVPPSYYDKPRLLYNPEKELRLIIHRNDAKNLVKEATQDKISAFFLTKHATLECDFGGWMRWLKLGRFSLMLYMVVWMTVSMMCFDRPSDQGDWLSGWTNDFFDTNNFLWLLGIWLVMSVVAFIFPITRKVKPRRRVGAKVFHSRVVVALLMGWFAIAVSEDLIKSQLELSKAMVWWSLVAVLVIVAIMLWGEVRQHSPYYCRFKLRKITNWPKVSVVLVYAMFWNLLLGIVMQGIMYSPLLETSGAMPDAILGQMPNEVGKYRNLVETCVGMLDDYDRTMDGVFHDHGKVSGRPEETIDTSYQDDFMVITHTIKTNFKQGHLTKELNRYVDINNKSIKNISSWLEGVAENNTVGFYQNSPLEYVLVDADVDSLCFVAVRDTSKHTIRITNTRVPVDSLDVDDTCSFLDPIFRDVARWAKTTPLSYNLDENSLKDSVKENLENVRRFKTDLRHQLIGIDAFLQKECTPEKMREDAEFVNDSLFADNEFDTENYYLAYLGYDASVNHKFCRRLVLKICEKKKLQITPILFPRMLIFHSLIVLIIAFVGQLIVSDKSVTEPL